MTTQTSFVGARIAIVIKGLWKEKKCVKLKNNRYHRAKIEKRKNKWVD